MLYILSHNGNCMASYITSVSVDNAWGGKVSSNWNSSVDDARKALLISTLSSKHQVDMNVPHAVLGQNV